MSSGSERSYPRWSVFGSRSIVYGPQPWWWSGIITRAKRVKLSPVINLKTAKLLRLTGRNSLRASGNEIIE